MRIFIQREQNALVAVISYVVSSLHRAHYRPQIFYRASDRSDCERIDPVSWYCWYPSPLLR